MSPHLSYDRAGREVENGFRQFDLCLELVRYHLDPERPFALRVGVILELQKEAVAGIEPQAGQIRTNTVAIMDSQHTPPGPHLVFNLLIELCDYINDNWHERTAFHLSAYAMWKLNWIHPFSDGNGRTARTLSYMLLCVKLGYILPGTPAIPQQIESDKTHYIDALQAADRAFTTGTADVGGTEELIRGMLATQLLSVVRAADTTGVRQSGEV